VAETKETPAALTGAVEGNPSRPRVLVVEDDPGIADALMYALEREGMVATSAGSLESARTAAVGADLAILDLGLPDGSGFTLLHEWRRRGGSPAIIVLTSRDADVDCVACLEAGADDFVAKPFSPRALMARVRAVLRRRRPGTPDASGLSPAVESTLAPAAVESTLAPAAVESTLAHARKPPPLVIDAERRTVRYAGRTVALTKLEFDLLAALAAAPGRVYTRDQLVRRVWGGDHALTERTVDSHVKALRRKLGDAGAPAMLISAVRGVGFKLDEGS
jgi:two-component system, OmpR family, catabolic regulation response regulator CreB